MEQTFVPGTQRSEHFVVLVVTGLSVVTGALYLWALFATGLGGPASDVGAVVFVAVNTAAGGLLWWRRRYPVLVFAAILVVYVVSALATGTAGNGGLTLALWFSVFTLTAYAPLWRAGIAIAIGWIVGTALKVHFAIAAGYEPTAPEVALAFIADVGFFYVACGVLGLGFRVQHQRASEAAERARLVEERAQAVHAAAVATERNRLARDLHDLAAHELMDVLLSTRALQIGSQAPELAEIEQKTARALDNMRTVVRTLRQDDDHQPPGRLPLPEAAEEAVGVLRAERNMSIDTAVAVSGPVDDALASTVLSVLKETVLNAERHAPGAHVTVALVADPGGVRLTVTNPVRHETVASRAGTGYGLVGAEERARLLGGTFEAGPRTNGDWVAELRLPAKAPDTQQFEQQEAQ